MKHFLLFGALTLLFSAQALAQFSISGKVVTPTGEALTGALVSLQNSKTTTDENGSFIFNNVPQGQQTLMVSFIGYETSTKTLYVNQNMTISIDLNDKAFLAQEVVVSAIKARKTDPIAYTELTKDDIAKNNFGRDIPYLLSMTPGMVVTSDGGTGIGYTNMRLRGTDLTRINITVNGIPLNDAESQSVYWVNMPDFASSVEDVQIQRGVGTSTNGAASFGGSVNFSSLAAPAKRQVVIDNSIGSYNTLRHSATVKTGLINDHYAFDVRLSKLSSDGYIDRASSDLKSFYLAGGYYGNKTTVRLVTFSGKEKTDQAWNGVPKVKLDNDVAGMQKLIEDDYWSIEEANNLFNSDARTFNRYLYKNQTDNYQQDHYQLHLSHKLSANLLVNTALHYTKGKGYYESYKYNDDFTKYNFPYSYVVISGDTVRQTNLIAQKWLDNDFYGATLSAVYQQNNWHIVFGGAANQYDGNHFGDVIWTAVNNGIENSFRWYESKGTKKDVNAYLKATYDITKALSIYADAQERYVSHSLNGTHDDLSIFDRYKEFYFFNPKLGLNLMLDNSTRAYASMAIANREPSRSDFRDAAHDKQPTSEKLTDFEAGFEIAKQYFALQLNGYFMTYKDQLVLTGEVNNVGAPIMVNVPKSYRAGIEVSTGIKLSKQVEWTANAVLSANKIKNFTEYVDNWDTGFQNIKELGTTDIALSPNITAASQLQASFAKKWRTALQSRYVGKQFIDNTSNENRQLDAYFVNDWSINYQTLIKGFANLDLGLQINNLLSEQYISNAWVYSYYYNKKRSTLDGYFPQAPTNIMARMVLTF